MEFVGQTDWVEACQGCASKRRPHPPRPGCNPSRLGHPPGEWRCPSTADLQPPEARRRTDSNGPVGMVPLRQRFCKLHGLYPCRAGRRSSVAQGADLPG